MRIFFAARTLDFNRDFWILRRTRRARHGILKNRNLHCGRKEHT